MIGSVQQVRQWCMSTVPGRLSHRVGAESSKTTTTTTTTSVVVALRSVSSYSSSTLSRLPPASHHHHHGYLHGRHKHHQYHHHQQHQHQRQHHHHTTPAFFTLCNRIGGIAPRAPPIHRSFTAAAAATPPLSSVAKATCPFHILGIDDPFEASLTTIKTAYYARAKQHHPDSATSSSPGNVEAFHRLTAAYDLLRDDVTRRTHLLQYRQRIMKEKISHDNAHHHYSQTGGGGGDVSQYGWRVHYDNADDAIGGGEWRRQTSHDWRREFLDLERHYRNHDIHYYDASTGSWSSATMWNRDRSGHGPRRRTARDTQRRRDDGRRGGRYDNASGNVYDIDDDADDDMSDVGGRGTQAWYTMSFDDIDVDDDEMHDFGIHGNGGGTTVTSDEYGIDDLDIEELMMEELLRHSGKAGGKSGKKQHQHSNGGGKRGRQQRRAVVNDRASSYRRYKDTSTASASASASTASASASTTAKSSTSGGGDRKWRRRGRTPASSATSTTTHTSDSGFHDYDQLYHHRDKNHHHNDKGNGKGNGNDDGSNSGSSSQWSHRQPYQQSESQFNSSKQRHTSYRRRGNGSNSNSSSSFDSDLFHQYRGNSNSSSSNSSNSSSSSSSSSGRKGRGGNGNIHTDKGRSGGGNNRGGRKGRSGGSRWQTRPQFLSHRLYSTTSRPFISSTATATTTSTSTSASSYRALSSCSHWRSFSSSLPKDIENTNTNTNTNTYTNSTVVNEKTKNTMEMEMEMDDNDNGGNRRDTWIPHWLRKSRIIADDTFNRWLVPPASIAMHLCIGSVYAWSMFNGALMNELGVVCPAADDWSLTDVVPVFSTAIVCLGMSAAVAGSWLERVGPRLVGVTAALCWSSGFLIGGTGVFLHSLPLLYLGYGILGGAGLGLGYVSPVSTLIRWFPDRRGMATGMAIMGFGGGAMIAAPTTDALLRYHRRLPEYLGSVDQVDLITTNGRRYARMTSESGVGEQLREVVIATAADLTTWTSATTTTSDMTDVVMEGVYVVGTGTTGAAATFVTLGVVYFCIMFTAAMSYRIPRQGWLPMSMRHHQSGVSGAVSENGGVSGRIVKVATTTASPSSSSSASTSRVVTSSTVPSSVITSTSPPPASSPSTSPSTSTSLISSNDVHIDTAMKTPQFWQLWLNLCCNVTAGIGVIGVAKTMMTDIFGTTMPDVVDTRIGAAYVFLISISNMLGRFLWASASDSLGRKRTFAIFFALGIPLYLLVPYAAAWVTTTPSLAPLVMFVLTTLLIFTFYGGGFATIPAYIADLFGTAYVGGIHGRLLTAWSTAGVAGPLAISHLRESSVRDAIDTLVEHVDDDDFQHHFGTGKSDLSELVAAGTVTIARLMSLIPRDSRTQQPIVPDPTSTLYDTTMYAMAGVLGIGLLCNTAIRPVAAKYHMKTSPSPSPSVSTSTSTSTVVAASSSSTAASPTASGTTSMPGTVNPSSSSSSSSSRSFSTASSVVSRLSQPSVNVQRRYYTAYPMQRHRYQSSA